MLFVLGTQRMTISMLIQTRVQAQKLQKWFAYFFVFLKSFLFFEYDVGRDIFSI